MPESIDDIKKRWNEYSEMVDQRKAIAEKCKGGPGWYFAFCGLQISEIKISFDFISGVDIYFQPIKMHPLYEELSIAMKNKHEVSRVAGYAGSISFELYVDYSDSKESKDYESAMFLAYRVIAALRIVSGLDFIVPMAANHSWTSIVITEPDSLDTRIIEDYPLARIFNNDRTLQESDLCWVNENAENLIRLSAHSPKMNIAIEALSIFHQQVSLRMSVVALWAGIEALIDVNSELRFRLAIELAAYLEASGESRTALYKVIMKMYDVRSRAVHGSKIDDSTICEHIIETRNLLRRILIKIIESNIVPSKEEFERAVLQ